MGLSNIAIAVLTKSFVTVITSLKNSTRVVNLDKSLDPGKRLGRLCLSKDLQFLYLASQDAGDLHLFQREAGREEGDPEYKQERLVKLDVDDATINPVRALELNPNKNQLAIFKDNGDLVLLKG